MIYAHIVGAVVVATSVRRPADMTNWLAVDGALPPRPVTEDDTEPRLMLVDGALVWQVGPTRSDIEAQRAAAYRDRCDPIAHELTRLTVIGAPEERIADARARLIAASDAINAEFPYPSEA